MSVERKGIVMSFGVPPTGRDLATGLYLACTDLDHHVSGGWRFPMARSPKSGLFDMGLDENGVAAFHPSLRNDDPLMLTLDDGSKVNTTGIVELAGRPDNLYILASRLGEIVLRPGYDPQRFPDMAVVDPGDMRDMIWHIHNSLYNRMHEFEPDDRMAECVTY